MEIFEDKKLHPTAGLELDDGDFILLSEIENKITRISKDGEVKWVIDKGLRYPTRIIESSDKRLYVSDRWNHRICVYNFDGQNVFNFGKEEGLVEPSSICFDSRGNLFVLNQGTRKIKLFSPDGELLWNFQEDSSGAQTRDNYLFSVSPRHSYRLRFTSPRDILYKNGLIIAQKYNLIISKRAGLPISQASAPSTASLYPSSKNGFFFQVREDGTVFAVENKAEEFVFYKVADESLASSLYPWVLNGKSEDFLVTKNKITSIMADLPEHARVKKYYAKSAVSFDKEEYKRKFPSLSPYKSSLEKLEQSYNEWSKYIKGSNSNAHKSIIESEREVLRKEKIRTWGLKFQGHQEEEDERKKRFLDCAENVKDSILSYNDAILSGLQASHQSKARRTALDFLNNLELLCIRIIREREKAYHQKTQFLGFSDNPRKRQSWIVWSRIIASSDIAINFIHALIVEHLTFINRLGANKELGSEQHLSLENFSALYMLPFGHFEFKMEYLLERRKLAPTPFCVSLDSIKHLLKSLVLLKNNVGIYPLFKFSEKMDFGKTFYPLLILGYPLTAVKPSDIRSVFNSLDEIEKWNSLIEERMESEIKKREALAQNLFQSILIFRKTSPKDYENRFTLSQKREEMEVLLSQSLGLIENLFLFWGFLQFLMMVLYKESDAQIPEKLLSNLREECLTFNLFRNKVGLDIIFIMSGKSDDYESRWEKERLAFNIRESEECYVQYFFIAMSIFSKFKLLAFQKIKRELAVEIDIKKQIIKAEEGERLCPEYVNEFNSSLKKSGTAWKPTKYKMPCFFGEFGSEGGGISQLSRPVGIAIVDDYIWVLEEENSRIQIFSLVNDKFRSSGFIGCYGFEDGRFKKPGAIISLGNSVFVADSENHRIQVFSHNGDFSHSFGNLGTEKGCFKRPSGIAKGPNNTLWVSDGENHRVQVFSEDGAFIKSFGKLGDGKGEFNAPTGITFDSKSRIVVGEMENNRMQIFSQDAEHLSFIGNEGTENGNFRAVGNVYCDNDGMLYAADFYNGRVQVFDSEGTFIYYFGGLGMNEGDMMTPWGVSGNENFIFVSDYTASKILCYKF